jgi:hypothetical protein
MVAGLKQQTEIIMAQIGTFTRGEDGVFAGTIKTLSLNVKARLVPADTSTNDKAPDLRVLVGSLKAKLFELADTMPLAAMTPTREDKVRAFVRETINTVLTNSRPN